MLWLMTLYTESYTLWELFQFFLFRDLFLRCCVKAVNSAWSLFSLVWKCDFQCVFSLFTTVLWQPHGLHGGCYTGVSHVPCTRCTKASWVFWCLWWRCQETGKALGLYRVLHKSWSSCCTLGIWDVTLFLPCFFLVFFEPSLCRLWARRMLVRSQAVPLPWDWG